MPRVNEEEEDKPFVGKKKKRFIAHLVDDNKFSVGGRKNDSEFFRRKIASRKIGVVNFLISQIESLVVVASFAMPALKTGLIDRFAVLAEHSGVQPILVLTKRDLVKKETCDNILRAYAASGYKVYVYSALYPQGNHRKGLSSAGHLREKVFKEKTTAVVGHSGVGKTTMLKSVDALYSARTAPVSSFTKKGRHTTTRVKLYQFAFGGLVYDMPGLKEIDFVNLEKNEVKNCFPEFLAVAKNCRFGNCLHMDDEGCAVKKAVVSNEISELRYQSYCNIYDSLQ